MICAISKKSEYLLAELIQQMIKTSGKYELDDIIKQVYDKIKEQTKNEDTALAYAGLVPSLALKIFVYNPQLRKEFKVSMDKIDEKINHFSDFENVKAELLAKKPTSVPLPAAPQPGESDDYQITSISKAVGLDNSQRVMEAKRVQWSPRPSYWATTGTDVFYGRTGEGTGVRQEEVFHFNVMRKILSFLKTTDVKQRTVNIPGVGPVYLKAVQLYAFAATDKVKDNLRVEMDGDNMIITNTNQDSTWSPSKNDVIYVLADKNGNYVYFDENGNVTKDKANGKVPYYSLLSEKKYMDFMESIRNHNSYIKFSKLYSELSDLQKKDIDKVLKGQMMLLQFVEKYAKENLGNGLMFSIWGGAEGRIGVNKELSKFDFSKEPFRPDISQSADKKNSPYFTHEGKVYYFKPIKGLLAEDALVAERLLFEKVYDAKTKKALTPLQKRNLLSSFFYPGKVNEDQGNVLVNISNFYVELNNDGSIKQVLAKYDPQTGTYESKAKRIDITNEPNLRAIISDILNNWTFYHVSNKYITQGSNFIVPRLTEQDGKTVLDVSKGPQDYTDWLKNTDKFEIENSNILTEEPYLLLEPTRQTYDQFMGTPTKPEVKTEYAVEKDENGITYGTQEKLRELHNKGLALYTMRVSKAQASSKNFGFKGLSDTRHFGNPFTGTDVKGVIPMQDIPTATAAYESWLDGQDIFVDKNGVQHDISNESSRRDWINEQIKRLRAAGGVTLGYFKQGYRSHAAVLAERINKPADLDYDNPEVIDLLNALQAKNQELQMIEESEDLEEHSVAIFTANHLPKINPESARQETGGKTGTKKDINPSFLSKKGITVLHAAEQIVSMMKDQYLVEADEQEVRDYIIDLLTSGKADFLSRHGEKAGKTSVLKKEIKQIEDALEALRSEKARTPVGMTDTSEAPPTRTDVASEPSVNDREDPLSKAGQDEWNKIAPLKTTEVPATKEQLDQVLTWYESSVFKKAGIPFRTLFNIFNSNAVATFSKAGITLYAGSDYSDIYHESWHAFTFMFLTQEQREKLWNEIRKYEGSFTDYNGNKVEFSKASDDQIEEYLAEDFRKYMLSNGTKINNPTPQKKSIFQKIYNFLKTLYGDIKQFLGLSGRKKAVDVANNPLEFKNIKELYENIRIGNLGGMTRRQDVRDFGTINKSIRYLNEMDDQKAKFSHADTMLVFETIESVMSRLVDRANAASGNSRRTVTMYTDEQNRQKAYGYVYDQFEKVILPRLQDELAKAKNDTIKRQIQKKIDLVRDVLENFGNKVDLKENAKLGAGVIYFHMMHSKIVSDEAKKDFFEDELDRKEKNLFEDKGPQDTALEELAGEDVVRLIRSLNKFDKKGNPEKNTLGEPKLMDFKDAFSKIMKVTLGSIDKTKMLEKIIFASQTDPLMIQLLEKLGDINSPDPVSQKLWTNFWQAFNKSRVKLTQHTVNEVEDRDKNVSYNMTVGYADGETKKVERKWSNDFQGPPTAFIFRKTGQYKGGNRNYLDLKLVLSAFPNVDIVRNDPEKAYQFLKSIGVVMTDSQLIKDLLVNVSVYKETIGFIYQQLAKLSANDITVDSFEKIFEDHPIKGGENIAGIMKRLNLLTQLEASQGTSVSNYMVGTATGDTAFEISLNNTMLIKTYYINESESFDALTALPHMNHLDPFRTPFTRTSIWKRSMFDQNGQRRKVGGMNVDITVDNLSGIKMVFSDGSSDGVATLNSGPYEKFLMEFHSVILRGSPELSRHGDKKTSNSARVQKIQSYDPNKVQDFKFIDDVDFILDDSISAVLDPTNINSAGNTRFFEIMLGYMYSEMDRMRIMREMPEDAIFDHKYRERGMDFVIFERMLSDDVKKELTSIATNTLLMQSFTRSFNIMEAFRNYLMSERPKLYENMRKDVHNYLRSKVEEVKEFMPDKMRFIDQQVYESFVSNISKKTDKTIAGNMLKRENITEALFHSYVTNAWINGYETSVWFYGDPAQYDQWQKRIQGEASTGDLSATDAATIQYIKSKGRPYTEKMLLSKGVKPFEILENGIINSVVLADSKVDLPQRNDNIEKALRKHYEKVYPKYAEEMTKSAMAKYKGITEGDGQAWASFDGYRAIKMSQGKWFDYHEDLYNRIVAGENIDVEKIEQFFPVAKWQHMGPMALMEGLPMNAMYKFSVFPLIPNVIKDRTLNDLHMKMMEQGVDLVLLKSGSKIANLTRGGKMDPFYTNNKTRTFNSSINFLKTPIFLHYLKDQQETGDEYKKNVTFPTQQRVLITDDLFENGVPLDFKMELSENKRIKEWQKIEDKWDTYSEEKKKKVSPMYMAFRNYKDHVDSFTKVLEMQLLRKIGWRYEKGVPTGDTKKLMEYVVRNLNQQDVASHLLDFIKVNEKGELSQDLSLSLNSAQIQKLMHALVNKEIIRQKANGQALVQVSRMGWEKPTQEQYEEYRGGDLPFYDFDKEGDNTKAMKVKIALQGQFRNLLNHPDVVELARSRNIDRLKALNMLIKDEEWLDRDNNRALITMVSTRIPVQGMNSMDFMEVAEFLPQNAGGIIIMPESIVGKSGSDFDIDKMFTIMPYILSKYGMIDFIQSKDVKSLEEVDKLNAELMKKEEQKRNIQELYKEKIRSIKAGATEDIITELQQIETEVYQRSAFKMNKIQSNIDKFEKLVKKFEAGKMQDEDATGIYDNLYDAYQEMENLQNEMDDKILRIAKSSAIRNLINERNEKLKPLDQELFSIYKSIQSGSVAGITNGLITSMKQLMERPENFINLIVPNSTDILDPVVDKMVKYAMKYDPTYGTGKVAGTTLFETPFNLYVQQTSSVAKRSLGIAAVGNVSKVRMNQIGMHLTPTNRRDMTFEEFKEIRKEYDKIRMQMQSLDANKDARKIKELRRQLTKIANLITAQGISRDYQPFMLQRIMMDHNQVDINGQNVVSLAGRFSKDGSQKTADVHNQIINVAVDVVKDPRAIFTIQGNLELIPVLELLIDSGVDLDTAVMFLTQPLIQEYKNEEAMRKGPLSALFKLGRISRNMIAYEAKFAVFKRHNIVNRYLSEQMGREFIDKLDYVFKTIDTIDRNKKAFSKEALEDRLKSYYDKGETEITDADKAVFLHFLELQQMAKAATNFKLTMNPDKSRAKNLFQVQERQAKIENIRRNQRVPEEVIDREYNKGLLSSFYRALNFQEQVFEDYFRLDNNKEVLDFMKYLVDTSEDGYNALGRTGYESEEVIAKAVNDFKVNLFQMALYDFDINDMDSYRGYQTSTDFKVVAKRGVVSGVYFEDGVAYVDKKKLELDYNNLPKMEARLNLAEVNKSNFPNAKDYYHFVFEREYLRHTNPLDQASENFLYKSIYQRLKKRNSDKTDAEVEKMAYEEYLRDRALKNVFNIPHMFRSSNSSMADMLEIIKRVFPDIVSENGYAVLKNLDTYFDKNGSKNIRLYDTQASGDMQTSYQEELMDLMDPLKMEKIGDDVSMEDKMILADFFSKLPIFSVLQSGFDLDTNLSIQSIMPQDSVTNIMQAVSEPFIREKDPLEFTPDFMDAFVNKFLSQNKMSNGFRRNFKDYVSRPTSMEDFYGEEDTTKDILVPYTEENVTPPSITFQKDVEGRTVFVTSPNLAEKNPAQADKMVAAVRDFFSKGENQNKVLVFNDVYNPKIDVDKNAVSNDWVLRKLAGEFPGNIVGIPTRAAYSGNYSVDKINETDEKYNTALSAAMDNIEDLALQGKEIIFNKAGYAQNQIGHSDNDASAPSKNVLNPGIQVFDTVSKELFRRFGYENPNFMKKGIGPLQFIEETQRSGIEAITEKRMPTHEEIMNKLKSCSK